MHRRTLLLLAAVLACGFAAPWRSMASAEADPVDFDTDVRPIFEKNCYECHGAEKRKGGLRLTNRRDAFMAGDSGVEAIVPGDASLSLLYELVTSDDPEERMPHEKDPLGREDVEILRRWIEQGATWPENEDPASGYWAYTKPVRPALPDVKDEAWPRNAIDSFVLARLEQEGLAPSPEADRTTLIRRLHLDVTGLPPTPDEVDAFVADPSPDAYEKLVDRLLASPHFGERWARSWLDAARYADSTGYQSDRLRENWAYRDWVIGAINQDMPFDQFTIEQIAGDLLPNPTLEQKIATGFNRLTPCNIEAGIHAEESRTSQVIDRVNTTSTVWLGTTVACAQCHNHKFDPISQEDYYRLFAFFNNTPSDIVQTAGVSHECRGPTVEIPRTTEEDARVSELQAELRADLEHSMRLAKEADARAEWEQAVKAGLATRTKWERLNVVSFSATNGEEYTTLRDGSVLVQGPVPDSSSYSVTLEVPPGDGPITAVKLEAQKHKSLPGGGPGRGDALQPSFVLSELDVHRGDASDPASKIHLYGPYASEKGPGIGIQAALDGRVSTGWSTEKKPNQAHWAVFLLEDPIPRTDADGKPTRLTFVLSQQAGFGKLLGRVKLSATDADPRVVGVPPLLAMALAKGNRSKQIEEQLTESFQQSVVPTSLRQRMRAAYEELATLTPATTPVMVEMPKPRESYVFKRGSYLARGETVEPGTPGALHPMRSEEPRDRLGLARWLVDEENPLVARVTVNRWWAELFGRGIVASLEDFGTRADPPTHPALLDWLAVELMENGWSRKHVLREILLSATYRQSSSFDDPKAVERDPRNELLWRASRPRLPAETIRDNALAISGLLSPAMGGPPVYPPQPDGIWAHIGSFQPEYKTTLDDGRFERGIYVVWRRAAPYPSFTTFDAPDRTACVLARPSSSTPLQALVLMNDEVYLEASLALAKRVLHERPDADAKEKLRHAFRLSVAREPTPVEIEKLQKLLDRQVAEMGENPQAADELVGGIRGIEVDPKTDTKELAAWFYVAHVLLNLDETVTRG